MWPVQNEGFYQSTYELKMMSLTGAIVVFLTSLTALPISYVLNAISSLRNPWLTLIVGLGSLGVVAVVPWLILRNKQQKVDSRFYALSILTFNSVRSIVIALENDGLIAEFMGFYLREGEPYFKTAHGTMISYWDGIAHYGLYLMMLAALSWSQSFCDVGLYWVGSFSQSSIVLMLSIFMGNDGIRLPFLLHIPCMAVCLWAATTFVAEKNLELSEMNGELKENNIIKSSRVAIWKRPVDLCLIIYFIIAILFTLFKFIAAMGGNVHVVKQYGLRIEPYLTDPLHFPKAQLMVQTFYFIPYYMMSIYGLLKPGQPWMPTYSLIYAGAAGQGQFSYMGASLHYRTPYIHRVPQTGLARTLFWIINGAMFVVPQIAAYKFVNYPHFFLTEKIPEADEVAEAKENNEKSNSPNSHKNK